MNFECHQNTTVFYLRRISIILELFCLIVFCELLIEHQITMTMRSKMFSVYILKYWMFHGVHRVSLMTQRQMQISLGWSFCRRPWQVLDVSASITWNLCHFLEKVNHKLNNKPHSFSGSLKWHHLNAWLVNTWKVGGCVSCWYEVWNVFLC